NGRGRINGSPVFIDQKYRQSKIQVPDKLLRLPAGGPIPDGNGFQAMAGNQITDFGGSLAGPFPLVQNINQIRVNQVSFFIQTYQLGSGSNTRIYGQNPPGSQRRAEQQLAKVFGKNH